MLALTVTEPPGPALPENPEFDVALGSRCVFRRTSTTPLAVSNEGFVARLRYTSTVPAVASKDGFVARFVSWVSHSEKPGTIRRAGGQSTKNSASVPPHE